MRSEGEYEVEKGSGWVGNELVSVFFFFKQKTAYEIYQCDWSSDVCSSDLGPSLLLDPLSLILGGRRHARTGSRWRRTDQVMRDRASAPARRRMSQGPQPAVG